MGHKMKYLPIDAEDMKRYVVKWIRDWFESNGKGCNAVIGISGGKDSSVAAALCAEALGADRVVGVLMPNGYQADIEDSHRVIDALGIRQAVVNIADAVGTIEAQVQEELGSLTEQTKINLPARIRMSALYAVSQSANGRVVNTCNLSEDYVGYATRYGDGAGDFSPFANLTTREVIEIGLLCSNLPEDLVLKTPSDGLCGKTDEESLGFSYDELNDYIRIGPSVVAPEVCGKIERLHKANRFKMLPMESFDPMIHMRYMHND